MGQRREIRNFRSWFEPPIFDRAAITLGSGPHSSMVITSVVVGMAKLLEGTDVDISRGHVVLQPIGRCRLLPTILIDHTQHSVVLVSVCEDSNLLTKCWFNLTVFRSGSKVKII